MGFSAGRFPLLSFEQANPFLMGAQQGMNMFQGMAKFPEMLRQLQLGNQSTQLANQWNPKIWQSEIGLRGAQTNRINKMLPEELMQLHMANELNKKYAEEERKQALLNPLLKKTGTAGDIGSLIWLSQHPEFQKALNQGQGQLSGQGIAPEQAQPANQPMSLIPNLPMGQQQSNYTPPQQNPLAQFSQPGITPESKQAMQSAQQSQSQVPSAQDLSGNRNLMDMLQKSIGMNLRGKMAKAELSEKQAQGYGWAHMTAETKNSLTAQGYGMGVDPVKMQKYVNQGLDLRNIAEAEGLDPDNIPPPIYPPTTATKTRTQQVEQVGAELTYLSSAVTALIKPFANTYFGKSPQALTAMLSSDPEKQKEFGRYIAALSVQSGLANGRVLLEGGRPGVQVMKMVKDSAMKGIHDISPVRMTPAAYEEAQKTIDKILEKGAKIRTTTGMNPFERETSGEKVGKELGKKGKKKAPHEMTTEEIQAELANG